MVNDLIFVMSIAGLFETILMFIKSHNQLLDMLIDISIREDEANDKYSAIIDEVKKLK